jgi:hypothetical protein
LKKYKPVYWNVHIIWSKLLCILLSAIHK